MLRCLDVKGSGASRPAPGWHNHGMLTLDNAVQEFFKSSVLEAALASNVSVSKALPSTIVGQYGHT